MGERDSSFYAERDQRQRLRGIDGPRAFLGSDSTKINRPIRVPR